jgi:hypothetical protein
LIQKEERWKFNPLQIDQLLVLWGRVSAPDGTISVSQLNKLTRSIYPPLGVGAAASKQEAHNFIQACKIVEIHPGRYTFEHTAFALVAALGEVPLKTCAHVKHIERVFAKHIIKVSGPRLLLLLQKPYMQSINKLHCHIRIADTDDSISLGCYNKLYAFYHKNCVWAMRSNGSAVNSLGLCLFYA